MDRAHNIRGKCLDGHIIGQPDQRLGCQVEDKVGTASLDRLPDRLGVPHIADLMVHTPGKAELIKQCRLGGRRQRKPVYLGPKIKQPLAQP